MSSKQSRRKVLVAFGAAAGALGAAAMMSAARGPIARADSLTDIINAVDGDIAAGQIELNNAFTDFGNNDVSHGLGQFFSGVDTDFIGAPDNFSIGVVDALTNQPVLSTFTVSLVAPADFATAMTEAQQAITTGETLLTTAATDFSTGDFANGAVDNALGSFAVFDVPAQLLLMGAVDQLF